MFKIVGPGLLGHEITLVGGDRNFFKNRKY